MRVAIVAVDDMVVVDGEAYKVDCSPLRESMIHAVQWYDTIGEEEFRPINLLGDREPNNRITDFSPYQDYVDQWTQAKAEADAEAKAKADAMAELEAKIKATNEDFEAKVRSGEIKLLKPQ